MSNEGGVKSSETNAGLGTQQRTRSTPYDDRFFESIFDASLESARVVAPLVANQIRPVSVVDFGCGQGTWLKAFREVGVETVLGIDGPYVDPSKIALGSSEFRHADLEQPIVLDRRFDLAVCLEVAEHLSRRGGRNLVRSLTKAASAVLFSAAPPGQKGTHHINEQWPEYWDRHFASEGYRQLDWIRPIIWQDRRVCWWYRQNIFLYLSAASLEAVANSGRAPCCEPDPDLEPIGRGVLENYKSFRSLLRMTGAALVRSLRSQAVGLFTKD